MPKLEQTKIDTESTLLWCPNFISMEEGNALFKHLMEGKLTNSKRRKESPQFSLFIFRVELRTYSNFYVWKACSLGKLKKSTADCSNLFQFYI